MEKYLESLKEFEQLINICFEISKNTHKREVKTWREEVASHLFGKFVAHLVESVRYSEFRP